MNPYTLPLFEGLAEPLADLAERSVDTEPLSGEGFTRGGERHLAEARRISKSMWRLPDHSPEQTQAGQEICRHLLASLALWSERTP